MTCKHILIRVGPSRDADKVCSGCGERFLWNGGEWVNIDRTDGEGQAHASADVGRNG